MVDLGLPNVNDVVNSWARQITAYKIKKSIVDFEAVETKTRINFKGVPPQPMTPQNLQLKPEGQRDWRYYTIYSDYNFNIDDIIEIDNIRYRITQKRDYRAVYGYKEYECLEDYKEEVDSE